MNAAHVTDTNATHHTPAALQALYAERSKHSSYQLIHPTLAE